MAKTILIVEDCEGSATALELAIAGATGFRVLTLSDARDALSILASANDVAALITDLHLPHMDGFELIEAVRLEKKYLHLPILVITGDSHPDTPRRVLHLGANAYFAKPYSPAELCRELENLLNAC